MVRTKNLTDEDKHQLAVYMLMYSVEGKLMKGKVDEASAKFGVSKRTVWSTFSEAKKQISEGRPLSLITKKWYTVPVNKIVFDSELIKLIPFRLRTTIRGVGKRSGVSKSTAAKWAQQGLIRSHTNAIKPQLNPLNKLNRIKHVLNNIESVNDTSVRRAMFKDLNHVVHIDEKWFYITKASNRYYLVPEEDEPYRSCQSKRFITKVMFMCAVARPIFGQDGEVLFDGKIGIFPFITEEPAVRNSKNRPAGTIIAKPIDRITKEVIRECVVSSIIPAIKARWPKGASREIVIQQDNARPHIAASDVQFMGASTSDGFNIILACQPPNSLDLNVLDLGFFRAIQSLQSETVCQTPDELVSSVINAYEQLSPVTLNKVFISLQACMIEILKRNGHNDYRLPHLGKDALARAGLLRDLLEVDCDLIQSAMNHLVVNGDTTEFNNLFGEIVSAVV